MRSPVELLNNRVAALNASLLRPMLLGKGSDENRKFPLAGELRTELATLFITSKRTRDEVSKYVNMEASPLAMTSVLRSAALPTGSLSSAGKWES